MTIIAVLSKKESGASSTVLRVLESLGLENSRFLLASPFTVVEAEDTRLLHEKGFDSKVAVGAVFSKNMRNKPEIAQNGKMLCVLEGRLYPLSPLKIPSLIILGSKPRFNREVAGKFLEEAEGDFSLIVAEPERILAARDPIGVQPLYYGENADCAALASNRTALWKIGINEACSFPSGNLASISSDGFKFKPVKKLAYVKPHQATMVEAAQKLQELLEQSIRVRLCDVKEVAVAFSGGLDSSVVAFLAKKCGVSVHLVHVSLQGQPETEEAKKAADELELPLTYCLFENEDVEKTVPKVVELIEEPDPVKAAVGIPFYWVAQKTAESGLKVLLAGQGADELFGGYQRYVNEYLSYGAEKVRETMFADVTRLHESNIERDEKICGFHNVELRLPFASFQVAEFASSLPIELKIERKSDGLRKIVLRKMAKNIGLSPMIVEKPKRAVQYSTGVNAVLGKIARKHGSTINEYVKLLFAEQLNVR
jgi:asparagine synthase (glutamine-hydrolysing)